LIKKESKMNKLMGFFELNDIALPTIPWREYRPNVELSDAYLWTIRSAVIYGNDLNLPRLVGKDSSEAKKFADELYNRIKDNGMVIYYPYFIAKKSGTLNVYNNKVVVEAVKDDLWNLVTNQNVNVSLVFDKDEKIISLNGDDSFLTKEEISELLKYAKQIRGIYRNDLLEGNTILLEWSYAFSCDKNKLPTGNPYLVFYEVRTTK
jgi:hypothetical protein